MLYHESLVLNRTGTSMLLEWRIIGGRGDCSNGDREPIEEVEEDCPCDKPTTIGKQLDAERSRQQAVENIGGGSYPAVDGCELNDDNDYDL